MLALIPIYGYFHGTEIPLSRKTSKLTPMIRPFCLLVLTSMLSVPVLAQVDSYILKRQVFKSPPTSVQISPDGKALLCGFSDGSFRMLDPESFELRLEVERAHRKAVNALVDAGLLDQADARRAIAVLGASSVEMTYPAWAEASAKARSASAS